MSSPTWSRGSQWLRWDPHLHTPGTLLNDQFDNAWTEYFEEIEAARPAPAALGITDYFTLRGYKEFRRRRPTNALKGVALVFPNIEMRLTIETRRQQGVNVHLLVSPDDPLHVERVEDRLGSLRFAYGGDEYPCTDEGLQRLGWAFLGDDTVSHEVALKEGARQFKPELKALKELFRESEWFQSNVFVAIAAGNDGLGGLSRDAGFRALREELGRFADLIFSGQPNEREFWLGGDADFKNGRLTIKPCLHGSDAHTLSEVLQPALDRRCWIRGDATFESLRQTLLEPDRRAYVGDAPPRNAALGDVVGSVALEGGEWLLTPEIALNDGLVTIIGAKGSGKTALVDLVALAAGADEEQPGPASFIKKARPLLAGMKAVLGWGDNTEDSVIVQRDPQPSPEPRVQYLSQHFVERLSTPGDLGEPLVEEIERVVFNAIQDEDRLQAASFAELRGIVLEDAHASQEFERASIRARTRAVAEEQKLHRSVPDVERRLLEAARATNALKAELASLPVKANDETVKAHQAAAFALQTLKNAVAAKERRAQELKDVVARVGRQLQAGEHAWDELKAEHPDLLDDATWAALKPRIEPSALKKLEDLERRVRDEITALRIQGLPTASGDVMIASLESGGLTNLTIRRDELEKQLGLDRQYALRRVQLGQRLTASTAAEDRAKSDLAHAKGARGRLEQAHRKRLRSYEAVFATLEAEKQALEKLYEPLRQEITGNPNLRKLTVNVGRAVDLDAWVSRGESLFDLRKPPFSDRAFLAREARSRLLEPWESGTPAAVRLAMEAFIDEHAKAALPALAHGATPLDFGEWMFSTDHIGVRYGIEYEGVEIARLSPGTRGVVLLMLYLALDQWDLRPLVIDQPEENLDPNSVYEVLVPFFQSAAKRRQIIMVTHNANLVVNTDSDQVIVAKADRRSPNKLPRVTYVAGGLEDPVIRDHVCRLLEGGRDAFRRRGERYGINVRAR